MAALRDLVKDCYLWMTRVHEEGRGTMDIVSSPVQWPTGLKEIEAKMSVLLQGVQSWDLPGTVPDGLGGTSRAVGDSVRVIASLYYSIFSNTSEDCTELTRSFLSYVAAASAKTETNARLTRLHRHLRLARDFELLSTAGEASSLAETATTLRPRLDFLLVTFTYSLPGGVVAVGRLLHGGWYA